MSSVRLSAVSYQPSASIGEILDLRGKLDHLNGAVWPVVTPANDDVALIHIVALVAKIAAFKFELNPHSFPFALSHLALCFAIRIPCLNGFDHVPKFSSDHTK